jgi:hypothetical protein
MANVMDVLGLDDIVLLYELSDELEGTLLCIAYAGDANDVKCIRSAQAYYREKYGARLEPLRADATVLFARDLSAAMGCVINAYDGLQDLLSFSDPKDREEEAKDILYQYLILPEEMEDGEILPHEL